MDNIWDYLFILFNYRQYYTDPDWYFEFTTGQSIGKKLLNIKTTTLDGKSLPTLKHALIESFGKSFLLPVDLVLGWFLTDKQRKRIFNRLSDTIVIKLNDKEVRLNERYYVKD